jgi:hypothetical protein
MLGHPVAVIAPLFRVLGEIDRIPERKRGVAALENRRKIENGKKRHHATVGAVAARARASLELIIVLVLLIVLVLESSCTQIEHEQEHEHEHEHDYDLELAAKAVATPIT